MKKDEAKDSTEGSSASIKRPYKNKKQFGGILVVLALLFILAVLVNGWTAGKHRSESYKQSTGAAGLNTTIVYDCDKKPCSYDFNVYILNNDGQQIGVVRPNNEGKVNMALAEGSYVMLIGKQFGDDKVFPQEPIMLKNGQTLELRLHYK